MGRSMMQAAVVALLLVGPLVIGAVTADAAGKQGDGGSPMPIATVLDERPVGEQVTVVGAVRDTPENYTAESGNRYQQFHISDGGGELLVFCSTADGRTAVGVGDRVRVTGTFKEFHGTLEVYTSCSAIERIESAVTTR
jgi:RecG-like helicase